MTVFNSVIYAQLNEMNGFSCSYVSSSHVYGFFACILNSTRAAAVCTLDISPLTDGNEDIYEMI